MLLSGSGNYYHENVLSETIRFVTRVAFVSSLNAYMADSVPDSMILDKRSVLGEQIFFSWLGNFIFHKSNTKK